MSFSIILQQNLSDANYVTKSINNLQTITGTLRNESSIIDPVILVNVDASALTNCNYMTIADFGRSYFIKNIISVRTGICQIAAHVDVLSSFATQLKTNTAIVRRQENNWNLYLDDGTFKVYNNPNVIAKKFPSGFTAHEFVLAVAGS